MNQSVVAPDQLPDRARECQLPMERVLIVDDHPLFSQGLAGLMRQAALASDVVVATTVDVALHRLAVLDRVDMVLLDITLQGETGLALLPRMAGPEAPRAVVVISSAEDETTVRAVRATGARGFLPKSAGRSALVAMCRAISRGHLYFPGGWQPAKATAIPLTPRQSEVLALLAQGFPNKRICQSLNLTEHTVKTHLKAIFLHLGVHNRTECVSQARLQGWL